ncbi:TPA: DNA-binding protein [Staphylococcus aureus]
MQQNPGEEVSNETLRSISNALGVTVSELYESVDSIEKEVELMEYSKKQNRQFHQRKHEFNAIRLVSWGLAFIIMAISFIFIDDDNAKIKLIRLFTWIFLLFLVLAFLKYFINVFISRKLDVKYPLTSGETLKKSEPIENVWQLIAERWWIVFPIGGFLSWLIPFLFDR